MFSDLFDDSGGDSSSSFTNNLLDAVTQLGTTAILAQNQPNVYQQYPYAPPRNLNVNPVTGLPQTSSNSGMLLFFGALVVVGGALLYTRH